MTVNILRWPGGCGGDMLLHLVLQSVPESNTNTQYVGTIHANGANKIDFSKMNKNNLSMIDRIALRPAYIQTVDAVLLEQELNMLTGTWWLKSHYYGKKNYGHLLIDIMPTAEVLPFVVAANINKTETLQTDFNQLVAKIHNPELRKHYTIYSLAKHYISLSGSANQILCSSLIEGWATIKSTMQRFNININDHLYPFYKDWLTANTQYFPGEDYKNLISSKNYDITYPNLNLIEKYCILAISGSKFKQLSKQA
jgi:hypothetical protein